MTYRELLNLCNEKPGCIKTKEQMEADSAIKYLNWAAEMEETFRTEKKESKGKKMQG